jgi:hypothetical protein
MTESQLQDAVRLALGADPELLLLRNNIGKAEIRGRWVAYGVGGPGGADLIGIFRGRFVAVEIKTATGRQSPEQRMFQQLVERKGGVYVVLRSVEDAITWLESMK